MNKVWVHIALHKYPYMVIGGLLFTLAETAIFGWNMKPESGYEATCDAIGMVFVMWGLLGDVAKSIHIEKHKHYQVNPHKIVFEGGRAIIEESMKRQREEDEAKLMKQLGVDDNKTEEKK